MCKSATRRSNFHQRHALSNPTNRHKTTKPVAEHYSYEITFEGKLQRNSALNMAAAVLWDVTPFSLIFTNVSEGTDTRRHRTLSA